MLEGYVERRDHEDGAVALDQQHALREHKNV
jgi:hypothetical protein